MPFIFLIISLFKKLYPPLFIQLHKFLQEYELPLTQFLKVIDAPPNVSAQVDGTSLKAFISPDISYFPQAFNIRLLQKLAVPSPLNGPNPNMNAIAKIAIAIITANTM
jgi:hypothetical protein